MLLVFFLSALLFIENDINVIHLYTTYVLLNLNVTEFFIFFFSLFLLFIFDCDL